MGGKRNYVWNGETFVDVTGWTRPPQRFPSIRRDTMDAAVHPATGEVMDSKSRFREVTKAHGLVEVGTDNLTNRNPHHARTRAAMQTACRTFVRRSRSTSRSGQSRR